MIPAGTAIANDWHLTLTRNRSRSHDWHLSRRDEIFKNSLKPVISRIGKSAHNPVCFVFLFFFTLRSLDCARHLTLTHVSSHELLLTLTLVSSTVPRSRFGDHTDLNTHTTDREDLPSRAADQKRRKKSRLARRAVTQRLIRWCAGGQPLLLLKFFDRAELSRARSSLSERLRQVSWLGLRERSEKTKTWSTWASRRVLGRREEIGSWMRLREPYCGGWVDYTKNKKERKVASFNNVMFNWIEYKKKTLQKVNTNPKNRIIVIHKIIKKKHIWCSPDSIFHSLDYPKVCITLQIIEWRPKKIFLFGFIFIYIYIYFCLL